MRKTLIWCFAITAVIALAVSAVMQAHALIAWWKPASLCVAFAALSGSVMWRWWRYITQRQNFTINLICHIVFVTAVSLMLVYICNYWGASNRTSSTQTTVVAKKYYKERQRTQRSGRRMVSTGEKYNVYYIDVRFPSGLCKSIELPYSRFRRIHKGDSLDFSVTPGNLGIPIAANHDFKLLSLD